MILGYFLLLSMRQTTGQGGGMWRICRWVNDSNVKVSAVNWLMNKK